MAKSAWNKPGPFTADGDDGGATTGPTIEYVKETMVVVARVEALTGLLKHLEQSPSENELAVACVVCAQGHVHDSARVDRGHLGSFIQEELARAQDELRRMGITV